MSIAGYRKSGITLIAIALIGLLCSACGGTVNPDLSYSAPAFLPFHFNIGKHNNNPTISGNVSWISELGVFSIGGQYELPPSQPETMRVILEDRHTGFDRIYQVRTDGDQFAAVVNGLTTISVSNDEVTIDITNGSIRNISFKRVDNQIPEAQRNANPVSAVTGTAASRWDSGWDRSWYKPFMLSSWAYDDSTVTKWYGAGFVLFLLRLILAALLGIFDCIFTFFFFIGQLFILCFGTSVWPGGLG
jgi:hypothetical protein